MAETAPATVEKIKEYSFPLPGIDVPKMIIRHWIGIIREKIKILSPDPSSDITDEDQMKATSILKFRGEKIPPRSIINERITVLKSHNISPNSWYYFILQDTTLLEFLFSEIAPNISIPNNVSRESKLHDVVLNNKLGKFFHNRDLLRFALEYKIADLHNYHGEIEKTYKLSKKHPRLLELLKPPNKIRIEEIIKESRYQNSPYEDKEDYKNRINRFNTSLRELNFSSKILTIPAIKNDPHFIIENKKYAYLEQCSDEDFKKIKSMIEKFSLSDSFVHKLFDTIVKISQSSEENIQKTCPQIVELEKKSKCKIEDYSLIFDFSLPENLEIIQRFNDKYEKNIQLRVIERIYEWNKKNKTMINPKHLMECLEAFKGKITGNILQKFSEEKEVNAEKKFVEDAYITMQTLISSGETNSSLLSHELYEDFCVIVFPNNASDWTNHKKNNEYGKDRSNDLKKYTVKEVYPMEIQNGGDITVKKGKKYNAQVIRDIHPYFQYWKDISTTNEMDMKNEVQKQLDAMLIDQNREDIEKYSVEEKLFFIFCKSIENNKFPKALKKIIIGYHFAYNRNIQEYIQGTADRVNAAKNSDYAQLQELHEFFGDEIQETFTMLEKKIGENNQKALIQAEQTFEKLQLNQLRESQNQKINNLLRYTDTEKFLQQIVAQLQNRVRKNENTLLTVEQRRENLQAIKQQIHRRKEVLASLAEATGNIALSDPTSINLKQITKEQLVGPGKKIIVEKNDANVSIKDVIRIFPKVFENEYRSISQELEKFEIKKKKDGEIDAESIQEFKEKHKDNTVILNVIEEKDKKYFFKFKTFEEMKKYFSDNNITNPPDDISVLWQESHKTEEIKKLNGYITKNKSSVHARMSAGVCVSGDPTQWDDESYLQMVLQDPQDFVCQGCILMNEWEDNGKKHLIISMNPSSTFLHTVNEKNVFESLVTEIISFAQSNNFDGVGLSNNKNIRTNRTGGMFERAMQEMLKKKAISKKFKAPKIFSQRPRYSVDSVDLIWTKDQ